MFGFKPRADESTEYIPSKGIDGYIPPTDTPTESTTTISDSHEVLKYTKGQGVTKVEKPKIPPFLSQDPDDPEDDRTIINPKILE